MYAIIATGGKQYKVAEGDIIKVEKLRDIVMALTIIIVSLYVGQPMRAISQRLILKNIISGTSCRICIISFGKPWKKMDMRLHCSLRS